LDSAEPRTAAAGLGVLPPVLAGAAPQSRPAGPETRGAAARARVGGRSVHEVEIPPTPAVVIVGYRPAPPAGRRTIRSYFEDFPVNRLACVVIDEAHPLITRSTGEVLTALACARNTAGACCRARRRWSGMSATPWRTSEKDHSSLRSYSSAACSRPRARRQPDTEIAAPRRAVERGWSVCA